MNHETITLALTAEASDDGRKQWVHLMPSGTFYGKDRRGPWTLRKPEAVIEASRRFAGLNQIPIDYEHQLVNAKTNGKPAPAAGWITGMQARDNGIWALVEWTPAAAAHIANREYRYLSPAFTTTKRDPNDGGDVTKIVHAGLVNTPNFDQLTAVANAQENQDMEKQLEQLKTLLGLDATADLVAVNAKVETLLSTAANAANPDPAQFVPIGAFQQAVAEANQLRQGITKADAEAHVATHIASGHIAPFMKEWAVSLCTVNKQSFDSFVAAVGPSVVRIITPQLGDRRRSAGGSANENLTETELAVCSQMGITAEELIKARGANEGTK
ncbi:phage protease [Mesorhizobium sp. M0802]|uniref:phage protease n=1 Tax=Mesorhizobium sp. M0802 TaxID=2957001 RepID=UPI00333A3C1B